MKILLTGASGLIGTRLVFRLIQDGHELILLGRNPDKLKNQFPIPTENYAWDPEGGKIPSKALDRVDAVIHLAGEPIAAGRWTDERKRVIRNSRVHGTRTLVDALIGHPKANPSVFICASGVGFYGNRGQTLLDETSPHGDGFLAEVSHDWEYEARRACEVAPKTRCVQLRIGMVLARDGGALQKLTPIFEAGLGGPIGSGEQWISWIHIDDLVELIVDSLKNSQLDGPVNAVSPQPVTNREFSATLSKALHRPNLLRAPKIAVKLGFGEMSATVLASQRALPAKALNAGFRFKYITLTDALADLFPDWYLESQHEFVAHQWVPRPVEEIFQFFSDAANLESITPSWFNFHVVGKSTPKIEEGTQIDYQLRLHGLPLRWKSRIEEWTPNKRFVDLQTHGPYSVWRHMHLFTPITVKSQRGTLLTDRVFYKVPFGKLGSLAADRFVKNDVSKIFEFRRKKIEELFSLPQAEPAKVS